MTKDVKCFHDLVDENVKIVGQLHNLNFGMSLFEHESNSKSGKVVSREKTIIGCKVYCYIVHGF